ncbi:sialate O-acetylesterase [Hymenobacter sp. HDW8]|uniref:sialate O-acetylesterase n=1 Tax=Hymenobacter sp. HDW8 TaxID=2714932 RepID=UPI0021D2DFAB|nr:sialate O-acetylesterase [Hymenobacter sp. HDW8]
MKQAATLLLSLMLLLANSVGAQSLRPRLREVVAPPARKEQFRLYLLIGQSNMAGRGVVAAQDTLPNPRVLRLNQAGQWEVAKDPVHFDKPVAGVGPGLSFGKALVAQEAGITVGLIPCAVGGSAIALWQPGVFYPPPKPTPTTMPWRGPKQQCRVVPWPASFGTRANRTATRPAVRLMPKT